MDISEILRLGATAIQKNDDRSTDDLDQNQLVSALGQLFGGEGVGEKLDFGSIITRMQQGGLGDIAASWLGNGSNASISADAVSGFIGSDKIQAFASRFGLSEQSAKNAIASALPEMVDKASPNGSLLGGIIGKIGGNSGICGIVDKFF
jgi:uncharacterized protein YidB (DUF937 family)